MSILLILVVISKTADAQVTRVINDQGCQMKISIESHTVLKNARKKRLYYLKTRKKTKLCFWYCNSFVTKNTKIARISLEIFFEIESKVLLGLSLELIPDDSLTFHGL